ncbi:MAG: hypothetical protein KF746_22315 [Chitinophagaceae bacterium]|nr:hypothetical protein [Chitinophagaceae bacterium]
MERIISDELTKYLLILGGAGIALSAVLFKLISKIKGTIKPYSKQLFGYLLITVIVFAIIGLFTHSYFFESLSARFIFLQLFCFFAGMLHVFYLESKVKWVARKDNATLLPEIIFTLLLATLGSMVFISVYRIISPDNIVYSALGAVLFFIVPLFFYKTFTYATSIPPKILKEWFYPLDQEMEYPDEGKLRNLLVISFEFKKDANDNIITQFRAKAPADMEFGQLFYYFINDYNERHPEGKIKFVNGLGEPNGWIFYKKSKWNSLSTNYIHTDKTIFINKIKENDIIICERSLI